MHQPMVDVAAWTLFTPPEPSPGSHIIVLAYPQSGADRLWSLLAGHPALACTAGTDLIPLCDQAARTWRTAEAAGSTLSTLAAASVRAMAGSLITVIKSRAGRERWCEISSAPAQSVRTFLQLYPDTRVICLHRNCADFISSATHGSARGPGGPAFGSFAAAHPGNPVAAAAAFWHDRTEHLLALEGDKAGQCHRVRHEDLASSPAEEDRVLGFLGLRLPAPGLRPGRRHQAQAGLRRPAARRRVAAQRSGRTSRGGSMPRSRGGSRRRCSRRSTGCTRNSAMPPSVTFPPGDPPAHDTGARTPRRPLQAARSGLAAPGRLSGLAAPG